MWIKMEQMWFIISATNEDINDKWLTRIHWSHNLVQHEVAIDRHRCSMFAENHGARAFCKHNDWTVTNHLEKIKLEGKGFVKIG